MGSSGYARVKVPMIFRPARLRGVREPAVDLGVSGFRVYCDEAFTVGDRLEMTLLLPDDTTIECTVRVAWRSEQNAGAPAPWEVGLELLEARGAGLARLSEVLDRAS
jgi:hypothetical protein